MAAGGARVARGDGVTMPAVAADSPARRRVHVTGVVQGVGFRPFLCRLAMRLGVRGFVRNDADGVVAEIEAPPAALTAFVEACRREAPPLAVVASIAVEALSPRGTETAFAVLPSVSHAEGALVPPDVAPCPACIAEVFDPANRRHLYPFTTCTDCGPRLSIVESQPYDRANTVMRDFPLCPRCAAEYRDPTSRRFHAEAIACPVCGPHLSHSIAEMVDRLADGGIVALKGLGGYHLACDAVNETAVVRLRRRKGREAKPFAVMVASLDAARRFAAMSADEERLLETPARPIVVLTSRPGTLAPSVSSGLPSVGLMLPSSMLHEVLLRQAQERGLSALVMTSGNASGEPVVIDDDEARRRLRRVADLVVSHNRRIAARADDSVMRIVAGAPAFVRRSRGYVPAAIDVGADGPDVLALGGDLKVTACVLKGRLAHLSAHLGDMDTPQAVEALEAAVADLVARTAVRPRAIVHDLHPDFATTLLAKRLAVQFGAPALAVQHHHAHAAAVAGEHGLGACLAVTLDGFGLGLADGPARAWGGEVLRHGGARFVRLGSLAPLPEPGGDAAAREPWRMAASVLVRLGIPLADRFAGMAHLSALERMLRQGGIAGTSSAGRLFDAAAALLGVCTVNRFEAEAAMRLEALADAAQGLPGGFALHAGTPVRLDFGGLLTHLARDGDPRAGAALVHGTVAEGFAELVARCAKPDLPVALAGGCFLNRLLCESLRDRLQTRGFRVLLARRVPCNDGGLALGQAVVGRAMLAERQGSDVSGGSG